MAAQNNLNLTGLQALPFYSLPAQFYLEKVDPTSENYTTIPFRNFQIGTFWLNTVNSNLWYLASIQTSPTKEGNWVQIMSGSSSTAVETLTGDSGGAVSPYMNNINVLGDGATISVIGDPATNTLTISADDEVSTSFPTDSGTAVPALGALTVHGGTGINTAGSGSTVTINVDSDIASSFPTDSGTAIPSSGALTIHGGTGITTSGSGSTVTINANGSGTMKTLTGNSGGAVSPDVSGNTNVVAASASGLTVVGNPGTNTLTINNSNAITFSVQTTNATPTTLGSFALASGQAININCLIVGALTDWSKCITGYTNGGGHRVTAGSAAVVGSPVSSFSYDTTGTPSFSIVASGNNILVQVIGVAATTINWTGYATFTTV